ncbi:MAG: hypothetical protein JXB25_00665, partial [Deltaproteobacteria bacterium]|nr:hypothetical protein [Deltaproteobacteria bacterium]
MSVSKTDAFPGVPVRVRPSAPKTYERAGQYAPGPFFIGDPRRRLSGIDFENPRIRHPLEPFTKVGKNVIPAAFKPESRLATNEKYWIPDRSVRG